MKHRFVTELNLVRALDDVQTAWGIQASNFELFKGAVFGRDSEAVGLDLVPYLPSLSSRIIFSLLRLMGLKNVPETSEEEPGRIHHEYRTLFIGGERVGERQEQILRELSPRWGGTDEELLYYGAVDATPQLIRLIAEHVRHHGHAILDGRVQHISGTIFTVRAAVEQMLLWLTERIATSDIGLLEFQRTNPLGHRWQVMRDGRTAYMHENGEVANADGPIATIGVQGLAYDAIYDAIELLQLEDTADLIGMAEDLRSKTHELMWIDEHDYYAMALDRHPQTGEARQVRTITSEPLELLETRWFDGLEHRFMMAVAGMGVSPELLCDVGVRMRGRRYYDLVNYHDYQGSLVSWINVSRRYVAGLRRQRLYALADFVESLYVDGTERTRSCVEFWYVERDGRVHYRLVPGKGSSAIVGTNIPENTQAWAVSALLAALFWNYFLPLQPAPAAETWRAAFDQKAHGVLIRSQTTEVNREEAQHREAAYPE